MKVNVKLLALFLLTSLLVTSCLEVAPRNRPTITPYNAVVDDDEDDTDKEFEVPKRPDGAVFLQSGGCGCKGGEPITLGNCASVCASKPNTEEEIFYLDVEVGEAISTSSFTNLYGWCNDPITYIDPETGETVVDGASDQAACTITYKDEFGAVGTIPIEENDLGEDKLRFKLNQLSPDKTYRIQITEVISGASSDMIQLRKVSERIGDPVGGPLWLEQAKQYSCLTRTTSTDQNTGDSFFETASRSHYYFIDEDRPEPLPQSYANIYCHDYMIYGTTPINRPLLEEDFHFSVWDKWDPRFWPTYDDPADTELLVHKLLGQKIRDLGYAESSNPTVFFDLEYYNGPPITEGDGGSSTPQKKKLGYYMLPFIDKDTYKAYCPTAEHYNSDNPLFQAMREIVGVDTEALYIAKQNNVCDIMLIRETELKKIWFYIENNQHIEPNAQTVQGKQIQFYWPPDENSPYVKKSHQRVYTVKLPTDSLCGDSNVNEAAEQQGYYPAHDKRIGCVPALQD